jgi:glycine dehydrogenase
MTNKNTARAAATAGPASAAPSATSFVPRHIGPTDADVAAMLELLGYDSLDALIDATVPAGIRLQRPLAIHAGLSEHEALDHLRSIIKKNQVTRSYLGLGYADCLTRR